MPANTPEDEPTAEPSSGRAPDRPGLEALGSTARPTRASVSVVIPTLGRPILEQCLYCLATGTQWPARLIVVHQGSAPEVAGWLGRLADLGLPCEHLPSSERGRALAVNRGLDRVATRFVAVTDDDCFVDAEWLERMADRLEADPGTIVTGRVEARADTGAIDPVEAVGSTLYRRRTLGFAGAAGGNLGLALRVIEQVGGFDEDPRIRTAEDCEWSYRALRQGVPILYAPEVVVTHHLWRSEGERKHQYESYARSHGGFYGKYLRRGDWFIALKVLAHHGRALRRWVRGRLTGDEEAARHGKAYFTNLLPGILSGLKAGEHPS